MTVNVDGKSPCGTASEICSSRMPARSAVLTQVTEWMEGQVRPCQDYLASEEPLEIRVGGRPITVTMRTPGNDRELAVGLLLTEGVIESVEQVLAICDRPEEYRARANTVEIEVTRECTERIEPQRIFIAASACGVCGKASIDALRRDGLRAPNRALRIDAELVCSLPDRLRAAQQVFRRTGGLHAAALFDHAGNLLAVREDIGRHNAVDKIVGWGLLNGLLPLSDHVLMVSGRSGFEIAQKAVAAGIPILASISAPSSLAVKLAREFNLSLVGFVRGQRFVIYAGQERFRTEAA